MGAGGTNYDRRDGFNDNEPGVESYGAGPGSGAYDPHNTGLGGYGNNKGGPSGHFTSNGLSGGGTGGLEEGQEDENVERREGFGSGGGEGKTGGTYGAGTGASASDPANTGLGGYSGDESMGGQDKESSAPGEEKYGTSDLGEQLDRAYQEGQRKKAQGGETEGQSTGEQLLDAAGQFTRKLRGEVGVHGRIRGLCASEQKTQEE